jgi:NAD/NADP transhydrogenase alpha subunit
MACFVGYMSAGTWRPRCTAPLMLMTNAISSVTIVGAMLAAALALSGVAMGFGFLAVIWRAQAFGGVSRDGADASYIQGSQKVRTRKVKRCLPA